MAATSDLSATSSAAAATVPTAAQATHDAAVAAPELALLQPQQAAEHAYAQAKQAYDAAGSNDMLRVKREFRLRAAPGRMRLRRARWRVAVVAASVTFLGYLVDAQPREEASEEPPASVAAAATSPVPLRKRLIPIRFVQFTSTKGPEVHAISHEMLEAKIALANSVFANAGVEFYLLANNIVADTAFVWLVDANDSPLTYTWPTNLSTSPLISSWHPSCTFPHPASENRFDAQVRAASYCAFDNEILVYVNNSRSNGGEPPWNSRGVGMSRHHIDNDETSGNFGVFPHELGHYLGLPHTFPGGADGYFGRDYGLTNNDVATPKANWNLYNPETGQRAMLSDFWDLVYKPADSPPATGSHQFFSSKSEALPYEAVLQPIEGILRKGHVCDGYRDPLCFAGGLSYYPDDSLRLEVGIAGLYHETWFTSQAPLKGLGFVWPGRGRRGINIMSYGYESGVNPPVWNARLSGSQIEQIQRTLRHDIQINLPVAKGVWGHRPLLGEVYLKSWEGFDALAGIELPGDTYSTFPVAEDLPGLCRNACLQEARCKAYTYLRGGSTPNTCQLKNAPPLTMVINAAATSGTAQGFDVGTDRAGDDYKDFLTELRPELCAQACGRDPACKAYTYVPLTASARCWLKNKVPARSINRALVSGVKRELVNIDLWGMDYTDFETSVASPIACQNACAEDARCAAYTYVAPTASASARCWLKSEVPDIKLSHAGVVSGIKRGLDNNTLKNGTLIPPVLYDLPVGVRECQARCAQNPACQAFNFFRGTSCKLLSSVGKSVYQRNVTSGIKGVEFF